VQLGIEPPNPAYVSLSARPARAVVFVADLPGIPWPTNWATALANQTAIWGGSANLLVPLHDGLANQELLWALIEAHDPDGCVVYAGSRADQQELQPEEYRQWRDALDAQLANVRATEREQMVGTELAQPLGPWQLPEALASALGQRTTAFATAEGMPTARGPLTGRPPWPLVDVLRFEPFHGEILEADLVADPIQRLLLNAELGRLPSWARNELLTPQSNVRAITPSSRIELIHWIYGGARPSGFTPFGLSERGCQWFMSGIPEQRVFVVVVGDDPWDFALAYALRRMRALAFWLPATLSFTGAEREYACERLARAGPQTGLSFIVTSASNDAAASELATALAARTEPQAEVEAVDWRQALPRHPYRLLAEETVGIETAFFLDGGRTPTPIPAGVKPRREEDLRWITDVSVRGWTPIRHPALVDAALLVDGIESRPTAEGVAYSCPNWLVRHGIPLSQQTRRPNLVPLPLVEQLRVVAAADGGECQLSHKGQFTLAACALFGGFERLCRELRDPDVAKVLVAYLDGARDAPGRLLDRRRYLRLADAAELGLAGDPAELVNRFERLKVLVRGLILKCVRCRYAAFYRPRDVDPEFVCARCSHEQRPAPEQWLGTAEPEWHYRLDEAVFQFMRQRGDLPALVAYDLFARDQEAVLVVPEVEFRRPEDERPREIDFAVVRGGNLYLGEAFTASRYERSLREEKRRLGLLALVADALNARTVIMATAAQTLDARTKTNAMNAFPGPRPSVYFREGCQILPRPERLLGEDD
jgi:hypothetical protein